MLLGTDESTGAQLA